MLGPNIRVGDVIRVMVIDDSESVRLSLHQCLAAFADFEWVGESSDGQDTLEQCERLHPDVVLLDVILPHVDVIQMTRLIRERFPRTQVIGISGFEEPIHRDLMLRAGAKRCLPKTAQIWQLAETVRQVARTS